MIGYYRSPWEHDDELEKELAEAGMKPIPGMKLPGRNDPCFCGSGKKFKKCCLPGIEEK